jgi:integrase
MLTFRPRESVRPQASEKMLHCVKVKPKVKPEVTAVMAHSSRHPVLRLDLRTVRVRIATREAPYWQRIGKGRALGYRKRRKEEPGTWFVRRFDAGASQRMLHHVIGLADDQQEANRRTVFSHEQALDAAQAWFKRAEKQHRGRFTVADAIDAYFAGCEGRGVKGMERMRSAATAHILPSLGNLAVDKLERRRLEEWRDALANSSRRLRTRSGDRQRFAVAPATEEQRMQRRDTANRIFTVLRAALNYAVDRGHVSPHVAVEWREVQAFRNVGRVRLRFLSDKEQQRLTAACDGDFDDLVRAGLFSGARFGELARLEVRDFDPIMRKIFIAFSKSGKSRHVLLTPEGLAFFSRLCNDRSGAELMLARTKEPGNERISWQNRPAQRMLKTAWKAAKIAPVTFHELRHTTASTWIRQGVPLQVVSEQLGHSSIAITVKYYGHLAKDWKAAIFDALPPVGLQAQSNRPGRRGKQIVQ